MVELNLCDVGLTISSSDDDFNSGPTAKQRTTPEARGTQGSRHANQRAGPAAHMVHAHTGTTHPNPNPNPEPDVTCVDDNSDGSPLQSLPLQHDHHDGHHSQHNRHNHSGHYDDGHHDHHDGQHSQHGIESPASSPHDAVCRHQPHQHQQQQQQQQEVHVIGDGDDNDDDGSTTTDGQTGDVYAWPAFPVVDVHALHVLHVVDTMNYIRRRAFLL